MQEFDTTLDLTDYLLKKENFFRFNQVFCPGEVNLAARYLRVLDENNQHNFVVPPRLGDGYAINGDEFDDHCRVNRDDVDQAVAV